MKMMLALGFKVTFVPANLAPMGKYTSALSIYQKIFAFQSDNIEARKKIDKLNSIIKILPYT